jgi:type IV pilus assembly protein PilM
LAKIDEISSTDKLIELIRTEDEEKADQIDLSSGRSGLFRMRSFLRNPISLSKSITIGVDLGHDDLKLVKMQRISDHKYEMLDYCRVPFEPDIPRESADFYQFLRPVLVDFCGRAKNADIWCTISSARVETRPIRIPKVAAKQIPNSVYWTYQKDSPFNEREKVFDFEILGDLEEDGITKKDVMAYTAPLEEIQALKDLFAKAGFPLTGISIVPYAFQTLLRTRRIETDEKNVSSLYIGRDWSRIDIFTDGNLMLSRGIKAGIRSLIEALREGIAGSKLELSLIREDEDTRRIRAVKKKLNLDFEKAQQYFFGLIHDESQTVKGSEEIAAREDNVFKMFQPALERLIRQVERTLRHYALHYENARVGKIYISSGVRPHQRILEYIGEELGLPTEAINPFASTSNFLTMVPWPDAVSEQSSYAPAMGMALATNAITPNFLHTYKDKQKAVHGQRINRGVFGVFFLLIAICVGIAFWQDLEIRDREAKKEFLQSKLAGFNLRVDQSLILKLLDQYREKKQAIISLSKTYMDLAVISEISKLTPSNIELLSISAKLDGVPGEKKEDVKKFLVLEGMVQGNRLNLESGLAGYMMELTNSPLFEQPTVDQKSIELFRNKEVLRFTAQLNIL